MLSKHSRRRILISLAALFMNVSATTCDSGTASGDLTSRCTRRVISKVVLPVPALAVTTTFRSKVVAARTRACSSRIAVTASPPSACSLLPEVLQDSFRYVVPLPPLGRMMGPAAGRGKLTIVAVLAGQDKEAPVLHPLEDHAHGPLPADRREPRPHHRPVRPVRGKEIEGRLVRHGRLLLSDAGGGQQLQRRLQALPSEGRRRQIAVFQIGP